MNSVATINSVVTPGHHKAFDQLNHTAILYNTRAEASSVRNFIIYKD